MINLFKGYKVIGQAGKSMNEMNEKTSIKQTNGTHGKRIQEPDDIRRMEVTNTGSERDFGQESTNGVYEESMMVEGMNLKRTRLVISRWLRRQTLSNTTCAQRISCG